MAYVAKLILNMNDITYDNIMSRDVPALHELQRQVLDLSDATLSDTDDPMSDIIRGSGAENAQLTRLR